MEIRDGYDNGVKSVMVIIERWHSPGGINPAGVMF